MFPDSCIQTLVSIESRLLYSEFFLFELTERAYCKAWDTLKITIKQQSLNSSQITALNTNFQGEHRLMNYIPFIDYVIGIIHAIIVGTFILFVFSACYLVSVGSGWVVVAQTCALAILDRM